MTNAKTAEAFVIAVFWSAIFLKHNSNTFPICYTKTVGKLLSQFGTIKRFVPSFFSIGIFIYSGEKPLEIALQTASMNCDMILFPELKHQAFSSLTCCKVTTSYPTALTILRRRVICLVLKVTPFLKVIEIPIMVLLRV